ncbi:MAG TPA: hypothetical protein VGN43_06640 [Steroidobacteraceae bacterium]|nr:hypothetical protein [Steroidobacteraceae bacterium]
MSAAAITDTHRQLLDDLADISQHLSRSGWSPLPAARTVRWHMGAIRLQAELSERPG